MILISSYFSFIFITYHFYNLSLLSSTLFDSIAISNFINLDVEVFRCMLRETKTKQRFVISSRWIASRKTIVFQTSSFPYRKFSLSFWKHTRRSTHFQGFHFLGEWEVFAKVFCNRRKSLSQKYPVVHLKKRLLKCARELVIFYQLFGPQELWVRKEKLIFQAIQHFNHRNLGVRVNLLQAVIYLVELVDFQSAKGVWINSKVSALSLKNVVKACQGTWCLSTAESLKELVFYIQQAERRYVHSETEG